MFVGKVNWVLGILGSWVLGPSGSRVLGLLGSTSWVLGLILGCLASWTAALGPGPGPWVRATWVLTSVVTGCSSILLSLGSAASWVLGF